MYNVHPTTSTRTRPRATSGASCTWPAPSLPTPERAQARSLHPHVRSQNVAIPTAPGTMRIHTMAAAPGLFVNGENGANRYHCSGVWCSRNRDRERDPGAPNRWPGRIRSRPVQRMKAEDREEPDGRGAIVTPISSRTTLRSLTQRSVSELLHGLGDRALHRLATAQLRTPSELRHPPRIELHLGHIAAPSARAACVLDLDRRAIDAMASIVHSAISVTEV